MAQCTAQSKRSGEQCKLAAMRGKTKCRMHGGKSLTGKDSPHYKTGKYSKYLPDRMADRYEEALQEQDLISLSNEIALIDSQLTTQLEELQQRGANGETWAEARSLLADGDLVRLERLLAEGGNSDAAIWNGVNGLIEQRRRLADTERRRLEGEEHSVKLDQVMLMFAAILEIIRRRVSDVDAQRAVAQDLRALMSKGSVQ